MTKRTASIDKRLLSTLNDVQKKAVTAEEVPVLVLAGAGSGKTRVLTHRIAYLVEHYKIPAKNILAVTFTNKAAREMKNRLEQLLKNDLRYMWVGTFHSIFARILRRESAYVGYGSNFIIHDAADQKRIIKDQMDKLRISQKNYSPKMIQALISRHKNELGTEEMLKNRIADNFDEVLYKVFINYQGFLKSNNAMDFDDLITIPVKLFHEHPSVLEKYQKLFQHILVDEFQDTNVAQNELVQQLAAKRRHVFVVGDDDQSIYGWRGAEVRNILNYEVSFPECKIFRLEQNYRSTKNILDAAYSVVKNNVKRKEKRLWTDREQGERIVLIESIDERDEAGKVVNRIRHEINHKKRNFRDFVVLYRTNAQSRVIEDALRRNGISYIIVGGTKFYERKEIKDFIAYLRVIANPRDDISLMRIINAPLRGIGETTQTKLKDYASDHEIPVFESLKKIVEIDTISDRIKNKIDHFIQLIEKYRALNGELSFDELARVLNDEIGFLRMYKEEGTVEALNRYDNIQELLSAISEYCDSRLEPSLENFLEEVALITDIDTWNDQSNAVTLMTLHSAKGLEFPVVFIAGLEEGLFPLSRNMEDPDDFEEERRLFYVGITRAKEQVYLSWAKNRRRFTEGFVNQMSSFVEEIDPEFLDQLVPVTPSTSRTKQEEKYYEPMPDYENESQIPIYIGCHVRHDMFGVGVVTGVEGSGEKLKISVNFREEGEKKLLYRYAQLEIL